MVALRSALRQLRRTPAFSLVVLLTLGIGVGATTAMFSVVRGVLLRPLPFAEPERVVRLWPANRSAGVERGQLSATEIEDWARELRQFSAVGAFQTLGDGYVFGDGPEPCTRAPRSCRRVSFPRSAPRPRAGTRSPRASTSPAPTARWS
jgi:hypothetical protein